MAFQLRNGLPDKKLHLPNPVCVLGVAGIYHFPSFLEAHNNKPMYQECYSKRTKKYEWEDSSPSHTLDPRPALWESAYLIVISHLKGDEFVDQVQSSHMIARASGLPLAYRRVRRVETAGNHTEIWQNGHILAEVISKTINYLDWQGQRVPLEEYYVPTDQLYKPL
jgi:hypothetical protein